MADDPRHSPVFWPLMAARALSEMTLNATAFWSGAADSLQARPGPAVFANPFKVELDMTGMRLLAFGDAGDATPILIVAPFALHDASIADFAPDHSIVAVLRAAGASCVHIAECKSANAASQHFDIDAYLAELNVILDELGGRARLVGLCQGGWLALAYAARFPKKVEKLALVGAPIDLGACDSAMTFAARNAPPGGFEALVAAGGGRATGAQLLRLWARDVDLARLTRDALQRDDDALTARFAEWYVRVVDLPGPYYLQSVEWLFQQNRLALGSFRALGRRIDLRDATMPIYLLAGDADEVAPPAQVLALRDIAGSTDITVDMAQACHLGLFMGRRSLEENWPKLAVWLSAPTKPARRRVKSP